MGKLSLTLFAFAVAACGSDKQNNVDSGIIIVPDAKMIDAPKVFNDAPPVNYNFTCYNQAASTTADDPVTIGGATQTFSGQGLDPLGGVTVEAFKSGVATALDTQTSAAGTGAFTTGNIATGGVPVDGYIKASLTGYRSTYVYPPNPITKSLANTPVPMLSTTDTQINGFLAALGQTDDTTHGMLLITASDCALTPVSGADITVKQGGQNVGTINDLGALTMQAAFDGVYIVTNVPDGETTIAAVYNTMNFPSHVVRAYQKPAMNAAPTITVSAVVPGPF